MEARMIVSKGIAIGIGAVIALAIGGGIAYAHSAATEPAQTPNTPVTFTAGQRYQVMVTYTSGIPDLGTTAIAAWDFALGQLQSLSPNIFYLVSASQQGTAVVYVVDVATTATISSVTLAAIAGALNPPDTYTVQVTSLGATPVGATHTAATGTAGSSSGGAGAAATLPSLPASTAIGQPVAVGWQLTVTVGPGTATFSAWPGDTIMFNLPAGASWRAGSAAPSQGNTPFGFIYAAPDSIAINWTDAAGGARSTSIAFTTGRTYAPATDWQTNDQVRVSASATNLQAAETVLALPASSAELAALQAAYAAATPATAAGALAQAFALILKTGPWGQVFAPDPATLLTYGPNDTLPPDWPASDTTGYVRGSFAYRGPGVAVPAGLPFPMTSWVRVT
jgi:hypothetical protein